MGLLNNKKAVNQAINQHSIEPMSRLRLFPDEAVAVKAATTKRQYGNQRDIDIWDAVIGHAGLDIAADIDAISAALDSLKGQKIFVDLYVRTPSGMQKFPNVQLLQDQITNMPSNDVVDHLNQGLALIVKITYDGGRPNIVNAVNWVKLDVSAYTAVAQTGAAPIVAASGNLSGISGTAGVDFGNLNDAPSSLPTYSLSGSLITHGHDPIAPWVNTITVASLTFHVDAPFIAAIILCESSGRNGLTSQTGAQGLMQLEPGTFVEQYKELPPGLTVNTSPMDPTSNIYCGTHYLSKLLKQFNSHRLAAAAYNAGPGAVQKYGNTVPPYKETRNYVKKVIAAWSRYQKMSVYYNKSAISRRPEILKQDATQGTSQSSKAAFGGIYG